MNRISESWKLVAGIGQAAARCGTAALLFSAAVWGATFGTVVPIDIPVGGHVSDIVLDEPRGVLYIANFTARRIDVMSVAEKRVTSTINVPAQPGAMAISPNGQFLVVTHVGGDRGFPLFPPQPPNNCVDGGVSVVSLGSNSVQNFCFGAAPLGVAFGNDDLALIVTTKDILSLDPLSGGIQNLGVLYCNAAVNGVLKAEDLCEPEFRRTLPVPLNNFPGQIVAASVAAAQDGFTIYGQVKVQIFTSPAIGPTTPVMRFRYDVRDKNVVYLPGGSAPGPGPVTVSVNRDGSRFMAGFGLFDRNGSVVAQFHSPTGDDNIGSHVIDTVGNANYPYGIIYAQLPDGLSSGASTFPVVITPPGAPPSSLPVPQPVLTLFDADNLTVRQRLQLAENLAGRRLLLNSARTVMYGASDSGVLILPVGSLNQERRVVATKEDVVFRSNSCVRGLVTQEVDITDPGGGKTGFQLVATYVGQDGTLTDAGISVSPNSGFTPARVTVTIDPQKFIAQKGTTRAFLVIHSFEAVNLPDPIRLLINTRELDQRGAFINVPGTLVDVLADPARDRFYILRQQKNDVLVYDSAGNNLIATMRTSSMPTQMTMTMDRKYLLVGHEDSQFAYVYDLDTLRPDPAGHIRFPTGHYPKSIAASNTTILAVSRTRPEALHSSVLQQTILIDNVQFPQRQAFTLPNLGIYRNCQSTAGPCPYNTILTPSADGRLILAALSDGNVFLFSDALHTFTTSRRDFTSLSGAYAASNNGQYLVDNNILNSSLVPIKKLDPTIGRSSGFVFANNSAFRTTTPNPVAGPPTTTTTECVFGGTICVSMVVPSPIPVGSIGVIVPGVIQTITGLGPDKFDPSFSDIVRPMRMAESPLPGTPMALFTRTLAALRDQSAFISLTSSGFTVIPWNYDAPVPIPQLDRVVNSADQTRAVAPGGLISVIGRGLPTALGDACLTANGASVPLLQSVSSTQVNAQLPFNIDGNAQLTLRTEGGVSDNLNLTILSTAPSVFRASSEGGEAIVYRAADHSLVSALNPVREGDALVIFGTGLGRTSPEIQAGQTAPSDPRSAAVVPVEVSLDGVPLQVDYAGLTPGQVGVYQIDVKIPRGIGAGQAVPLVIRQGGMSTTVTVPVTFE